MTIFLVVLIGIALLELKAAGPGEFFQDYLSRERTAVVNGLFSLLIFLSHASAFLSLTGPEDTVYLALRSYLDQLVVVPFLFYSGYGIMESIHKKGMAYIYGIPFRRFFRVFTHMAAAVCLYICVNLILGRPMDPVTTLLAFTGWTSIGNSNWYVFAILALYVIVFLSFLLARGNPYLGTALTAAASVLFVYWQMRIGREPWTYNTVLLFPVGMVFSLGRPLFERLMARRDVFWYSGLGVLLSVFLLASSRRSSRFLWYTLWAVLFMLLLVTLSMKLRVNNSVLQWLGSHIFSFYILQRIPFLVLSRLGLQAHKFQFVIASFLFTLVLAALFDQGTAKLDSLLYAGKEKKAG